MKTIIKKAKHLAVELGITERAVTIRAGRVKLKEYALNKKRLKGYMSIPEYEKALSEMDDKQLAGYSCQFDWDGDQPQYTFYKNV